MLYAKGETPAQMREKIAMKVALFFTSPVSISSSRHQQFHVSSQVCIVKSRMSDLCLEILFSHEALGFPFNQRITGIQLTIKHRNLER